MNNTIIKLGSVSHNKDVLLNLNELTNRYEETELLDILFTEYFDDEDLINITNFLKERK